MLSNYLVRMVPAMSFPDIQAHMNPSRMDSICRVIPFCVIGELVFMHLCLPWYRVPAAANQSLTKASSSYFNSCPLLETWYPSGKHPECWDP